MSAGHVVVVGSGVIGTACAYYLLRAGWKVTIIDQGQFGRGCSHANCGYVCPSHVLPLTVPGALRQGLKALLVPNSPFRIKPRFDPALWSWLFRFARRCNRRDMMAAAHAMQPLLNSSRSLYSEIIREECIACDWEERGLLFVFQSKSALDHYAETDRLLRDEFALPAKRFDGDGLCGLEPALKTGLAGAYLYETDAHLRSDLLMSGWRQVLERQGAAIRTNCSLQEMLANGHSVSGIVTSSGTIEADAIVVATGAWTPQFAKELGCRIPIQPGKGYSITMPRPSRCPVLPMIFEEHRVAVTPFSSGYRIGSTMEFAGYDTSLNPKRLELLKNGARYYLHEPYSEPIIESWYGWRPMTYDGLPIVGPSPRFGNVWIAAGHNMLGLSMAPATGKLIAEMLTDREPHIDPGPYSVTRFGN